jgi:hypothetical protein
MKERLVKMKLVDQPEKSHQSVRMAIAYRRVVPHLESKSVIYFTGRNILLIPNPA